MQKRLVKRLSQLMDRDDRVKLINVPLAKRSFQPSLSQSICNFCHKPRRYKCDCRMENRLCLACGIRGHLIRDCPFRKIGNIILIRRTLLAPLVRRNSGPVGRRTSFLSQRYFSNQAQRRPRARTCGRKSKRIIWQKKEAQILDRVGIGGDAQYLELEPWRCHSCVNPNLSCPELVNFSLL